MPRPIKLIIQIPCFNEEATLPATVADLPRAIPGVDVIEYLVIDDGSTDRTVEVARQLGVHHIVSQGSNRGLAKAFLAGLEASLRAGADIIVNTDADNQYCGNDIPKLVEPVLEGTADFVVGTRPLSSIQTFSPLKKALQHAGTGAVRALSGTDVRDATSGFRAFTRDAALRLQVHGRYTYTLETIMQAGAEGLRLAAVPIGVNPQTRESRLVKSSFDYVRRSIPTILRSYARYRPMHFFGWLSAAPGLIGLILIIRWFVLRMGDGDYRSRVPSLVGAAIMLVIAAQLLVLGLIADMLGAQRKATSDMLVLLRRRELAPGATGRDAERGEHREATDSEHQVGDHHGHA